MFAEWDVSVKSGKFGWLPKNRINPKVLGIPFVGLIQRTVERLEDCGFVLFKLRSSDV